jgi:uncharacterized SAM-binding protein YcdF (DUF218 family)
MSVCLIIFGAAVRADGKPSGTLSRRVEGALSAAKAFSDVIFMPTGGAGKNGIVEADTIANLLRAAGVEETAIVCERRATDTFESVLYCDRLLRQIDSVESVAPCTSRYHIVRCGILFRLLGWKVRDVTMPSDWGHLSRLKLLTYYCKEFISTPYDILLVLTGARHRSLTDPAA